MRIPASRIPHSTDSGMHTSLLNNTIAVTAYIFPLHIPVLNAPQQARTQKIGKMLRKACQFILIHEHALSPERNVPATLDCRKQHASPRAFKGKGRQYSLLYRLRIRQTQHLVQQSRGGACPSFASQHLTARGKIPALLLVRFLPEPACQP